MQDARIRIASTIMLSLSAFTGTPGSAMVFIWWILFSKRQKSIPSPKLFTGLLVMTGAVSLILIIGEGDGLSYFVKMSVILLIAGWAYTEIQTGDMLNVLTWALGEKRGFELGLVSEMSLIQIRKISQDYKRAKIAVILKKNKFGMAEIIPVMGNILIWLLRESGEHGKILALRGYTLGGTLRTKFNTTKKDLLSLIFSIGILLLSLFELVRYL
ncbi:hypothetical protein F1737_04695 [Methanoplanus sp. FWC-SCC4]|uniref:Uncharacterized protein n=1 Tax=Methanochimaera problematica TaxID=2609417 RepID=A0AA97FCL7_9EURY|nr:hypothetical protein [Methanoplanus sp. FWC-SCC4]WOF16052.1 hypothetical protein F1737_04695 [Methanoplanus sp. FWC-SCC4]